MSIDEAIQRAFPLVAVPTSSATPPATCSGMRFLAGRNGVYREINLPWIRMVHCVAPSSLPLPYGGVDECIELRCGSIPGHLIRSFMEDAKKAFPHEAAAAFLWNDQTFQWRYARRESLFASSDALRYAEVTPWEGEHLVVDVHSHGRHDAFFSEEDDRDDAGAMKISLVVGNLDRELPSSKMRLCMAGHTIQPAFLGADGTVGLAT